MLKSDGVFLTSGLGLGLLGRHRCALGSFVPSEATLLRSWLLRAFLLDELAPIDEYAGSKTLAMTARAQLVDFSARKRQNRRFGAGRRSKSIVNPPVSLVFSWFDRVKAQVTVACRKQVVWQRVLYLLRTVNLDVIVDFIRQDGLRQAFGCARTPVERTV